MILTYQGIAPKIAPDVFIAPSADIVGDVEIGAGSSVWFQVVIRGDVNTIRIGDRTNVQDLSMLHVTRRKHPLVIGSDVTIGHRVTLHGCHLGDRILMGMGSIVLDGAQIGSDCIIGAGALVTQGAIIPAGSLVYGSPARVVRTLSDAERSFLVQSAQNYVGDSITYRQEHPQLSQLLKVSSGQTI